MGVCLAVAVLVIRLLYLTVRRIEQESACGSLSGQRVPCRGRFTLVCNYAGYCGTKSINESTHMRGSFL